MKIQPHPLDPAEYANIGTLPSDEKMIEQVLADMPNFYKMGKFEQEHLRKHLKKKLAGAREMMLATTMKMIAMGLAQRVTEGKPWEPSEFASEFDYSLTVALISVAL